MTLFALLGEPAAAVTCTGTTYNVRLKGGGTDTSIQDAVDKIPYDCSATYCVNVDTSPYIEQV
ncbi:MAG: hypothetical protein PHF00_12345, partial [Elusimicrobia bacterium]|nr:hypothetical protein [Elusimicrobiota bacterium]